MLAFEIPAETLIKGGLATIMAFVIFVGSVLLMLSAVFGRRMGYLVLAVSFFGWMIIFSALWVFGAPGTPTDLGPRGSEPAWLPIAGGIDVASEGFPEVAEYPSGRFADEPGEGLSASIQSVTGAFQAFLAEQANHEAGLEEGAPDAFVPTDFAIEGIRFGVADDGKTNLAVAQGVYEGGGPLLTLVARHDSGSVPRYSWMFLGGSILGLLIHLPFLDRAERRRREILTGGAQPPWHGPA